MTSVNEETDRVDSPSLDDFFSAMATSRRRHVLYHLRETDDGVASFDELSAFVLANDPEVAERAEIDVRLRHVTLPTLEDAGLLEYDSRSETARYRADGWFEGCIAHGAWIESS